MRTSAGGGAVTSASLPDPYVPPDGDWNVTGDITASGDVEGGTLTSTGGIAAGGAITGITTATASTSFVVTSGWTIGTASILADNAGGPALLNEATSNTNPVFAPDRADATTGIGGTDGGADIDAIIAGASVMNWAAAAITATQTVSGSNAAGPAFANEASTATNPTLVPDKSELGTGIGGTGDGLSLIALSNEVINIAAAGGVTITQAVTDASTPNEDLTVTSVAHTDLADANIVSTLIDMSATLNFVDVTTDQTAMRILAPTYTSDDGGGDTIANAATLYIDAAPTGGTNVTITDNWVISAARDADGDFVFGRGVLGTRGVADNFHISHYDQRGSTVYALRHDTNGGLVLNHTSGQTLSFRASNSGLFTLDATNGFYGDNATAAALLNEASSATNPTLCPDRSELGTGIGGTSDGLSLIALSVEIINIASTGGVTITQAITDASTPNEDLTVTSVAHTDLADANIVSTLIDMSATLNFADVTTDQTAMRILAPTYTSDDGGGDTVTTASTFYVNAAPTGGANVTITNPLTAHFDAGSVAIDEELRMTERADHVSTPAATFGYVWVKNDAPTALHFTDDTGIDIDLVNGVYGAIFISLGSTTQVTNGTADTFDLMTGWNTAQGANGLSNETTPAKASNKITLDKAGTYEVDFCCSFVGSTPAAVYTCQAFVGAAAQVQCTGDRETDGGDVGSMSFCGLVTATAAQDLDVRVASDGTSDNFTPLSAQLIVKRVGN